MPKPAPGKTETRGASLHSYDRDDPIISNSFLKYFYCFILQTFSPADILDFFGRVGFSMEQNQYRGHVLLRHIWDERGWSPVDFFHRMVHELEYFFVHNDKNFRLLFDSYAQQVNELSMSMYFTYWQHFSPHDTRAYDIADFPVSQFPVIVSQIVPRARTTVEKIDRLEQGMNRGVLSFAPDYKDTSSIFRGDMDISLGIPFRFFPAFFGFKPLSEYRILSSIQFVEDRLIRGEEVEFDNDRLMINGVEHGRIMRFHDYLSTHGLAMCRESFDDCEVVYCTKPYRCHSRGCDILTRETVYGAPVTLMSVLFPTISPDRMSEAMAAARQYSEAQRAHQEHLLRLHEGVLSHPEASPRELVIEDTGHVIRLNGKHVTSGTQAQMLRKILLWYVKEGKTSFEYRDLSADDTFICVAYNNTGITTRLKRISEKLQKCSPHIRLYRVGKGNYRLDVQGRLTCQVADR